MWTISPIEAAGFAFLPLLALCMAVPMAALAFIVGVGVFFMICAVAALMHGHGAPAAAPVVSHYHTTTTYDFSALSKALAAYAPWMAAALCVLAVAYVAAMAVRSAPKENFVSVVRWLVLSSVAAVVVLAIAACVIWGVTANLAIICFFGVVVLFFAFCVYGSWLQAWAYRDSLDAYRNQIEAGSHRQDSPYVSHQEQIHSVRLSPPQQAQQAQLPPRQQTRRLPPPSNRPGP
jgi:cation transport ATPase